MNTFFRTVALLVVVALGFGYIGQEQDQHAACRDRQRQYDGQILYTRFLGREFHATGKQIEAGLRDWRRAAGPRPSC